MEKTVFRTFINKECETGKSSLSFWDPSFNVISNKKNKTMVFLLTEQI